jgi:hypothetical protein
MKKTKLNDLLLEQIIKTKLEEMSVKIGQDVIYTSPNNKQVELIRGDYLKDFIHFLIQDLYSFGFLKLGARTQEKDIQNVETYIEKMVNRIFDQIESTLNHSIKRNEL